MVRRAFANHPFLVENPGGRKGLAIKKNKGLLCPRPKELFSLFLG